MSIRLRLTLWYVALLCVGLALFGGAILWQTERAASAALDESLRRRAADVAADINLGPPITLHADAPDESTRDLGEMSLWIRVLDPQGHVALQQGPRLAGAPAVAPATLRPGLYDRKVGGEESFRLFVRPVMGDGRHAATIQVLTTTRPIKEARERLLAAMGAAAALIVLGAALGGLFLAERALRPVDRLTRLAGEIGADQLHRRVSDEVGRGVARHSRDGRGDELARLARTFDAMLARIEEASERRRRLTADAAHELATPIATIASGAEIALRRPRTPSEYEDALRRILDESRHMGRMVDDLLLLARADAGRLPLQHDIVEIDDVCRGAIRAFEPLATARAIRLTADLPSHATLVLGDELRLTQVVRNLLDNALRYTPTGGVVRLILREDPRDDDNAAHTIVMRVCDTGPGIPPDERDPVFERFHRAREAPPLVRDGQQTGHAGGSGLGLAICKAIVASHGGRISVEDSSIAPPRSPTPGTDVVVALPALEFSSADHAENSTLDQLDQSEQTGLADPADKAAPTPAL